MNRPETNIHEFHVMDHEFRPSEGQQAQLTRMLQEAAQDFKRGDVGLCVQKLESVQVWALIQVGVFDD